MYLLDANVLIDAHRDYYAIDRVPPFWDWLLHHANAGAVKMPAEIFEEIAGGGQPREGDLLVPFLRRHEVKRSLVLREEVNDNSLVVVLAVAYGGPTPTEAQLIEMGRDPFLVASAHSDFGNRTVVTAEVHKPTRAGPRRHVPNACEDMGVRWLSPYNFFRELDFALDWRDRLGIDG